MTKQKPHTGLDYFREHPLPYPVAYRKNARISIVVEAVGYLWGELSVRYQMLREDRHLVRRTVLYKPAENLIKKFCVPEIPSILAEQEAKKEWGKALVIGRRKAKREAKERQREANDKN